MIKANYGRLLHCSSIGVKFGGGNNSYSYSLAKHCLEFMPQFLKKILKQMFCIMFLGLELQILKYIKELRRKI